MKTNVKLVVSFIFILLASANSKADSGGGVIKEFKIFSGDKKATYYAVASSICKVFNRDYSKQGFKCVAMESEGSEKNLKLLAIGKADLAIIKTSEFNERFVKGSEELQSKTKFVAKIHDEYLTVLAQRSLKVRSLTDLENKVVNVGNVGSTSHLIVQKYFLDFMINPKKIVNFGAAKSFEKLCRKEVDAWVYFIGHPNNNFQEVLEKCDLEIVAISQLEVDNFLNNFSFLRENILSKDFYKNLQSDIKTVSSPTIIASKGDLNPIIAQAIQDILKNHESDLAKENPIFKSF